MLQGSRIGPYRVVRLLGKGGMGVVYEAVQESISRRVALKVLNAEYTRNPEAVQRLFNEARAVNLIDHRVTQGWLDMAIIDTRAPE